MKKISLCLVKLPLPGQVPFLGLLSVLVLFSVLVTACGSGEAGSSAEPADAEELEKVLAISDSSERRKELLLWNLDHGYADAAMIYLARERVAEGSLMDAEILLKASRELSVGAEARRLGDYLEGYLAFLREDYGAAEDFLGRTMASIGNSGESEDLKERAELLFARSIITRSMVVPGEKTGKEGQENLEKAAELLLALRDRHSSYLNEAILLELTALLLELGRREEAGDVVGDALHSFPYNPQTVRFWENLAGEAGLAVMREITKLERKLISGLPCDYEKERGQVVPVQKICSFVKTENWPELKKLTRSLKNAESHRLIAFITALSDLRGQNPHTGQGVGDEALETSPEVSPEAMSEGLPATSPEALLEAYLEAGRPYRKSQFYYFQLWKSIDGWGEKYEALLVETLKACIVTGPSTERALEARRRLAVAYGAADLPGPLPMTETEMKKLSDCVLQGAPAEILQPMLEFLEWPDNPGTLRAELILRGVRDVPEIRDFMEEFLNGAGPRAEERVRSILRF